MIERLWRHDALRVQLQSRIGVVVASAVLLVAGRSATAQEFIDFEDPPYTGSAAGTIITDQDGFYIPVPDSQDGLVYTYVGNALGMPGNPTADSFPTHDGERDVRVPRACARHGTSEAQRDWASV